MCGGKDSRSYRWEEWEEEPGIEEGRDGLGGAGWTVVALKSRNSRGEEVAQIRIITKSSSRRGCGSPSSHPSQETDGHHPTHIPLGLPRGRRHFRLAFIDSVLRPLGLHPPAPAPLPAGAGAWACQYLPNSRQFGVPPQSTRTGLYRQHLDAQPLPDLSLYIPHRNGDGSPPPSFRQPSPSISTQLSHVFTSLSSLLSRSTHPSHRVLSTPSDQGTMVALSPPSERHFS